MTIVGVCGFVVALACAIAGKWFPTIFFLIFGLIYLISALFEKRRLGRSH